MASTADPISAFKCRQLCGYLVVSAIVAVVCIRCTNARNFTIQELVTKKYPHLVSNDLYLDPCKSDGFLGDIALGRAENEIYEKELAAQNGLENKDNETEGGSNRKQRAATARPERLWDHAVIPYVIESNFSGEHRALFKQAMRHWENYTCVKFVEKGHEHQDYIEFTERPCGPLSPNSCCSFVGKRGNGAQAISIGKNCDKFGIVVHELGHVVGFWHEHTRPDRDNHVQIITKNIMIGQEYNFNKLTEEEVNSLGLPYDYDSIMHYARNTFSKSTYLDTILPQEEPLTKKMPEIGQRRRLSRGDISQTNMLYDCPRCGHTIQEPSGTLTSPHYSPPEGQHCEWRITATHGERIVLNITELDMHDSPKCDSDYLEIRDGYWIRSPMLGRLCAGNVVMPQPFISSSYRLLVTYKTSSKHQGHKGFVGSYEAICGGEVVMEEGVLQSPNFPEDYRPNKECTWRITVPDDYQIALQFQSFEIENHDNCVYDYLEVHDGHDHASKLLGKFCGYKAPEDVLSSSNRISIKFVSDSSVQKTGFSAKFMKELDECKNTEHGCDHECVNTLGGYRCECRIGYELHSDGKKCEDACGGIIDAMNGTIVSPSFPDMYPPNKNCAWEIIALPQYRISLNFTHFDLEGNNQDCEYDSVDIRSKLPDNEVRKHGVFCGSHLPPTITSEGNNLRIEFNSDNSVQKSGFAAVFFTDRDECATNNGGCQHICKNTLGSYACSCHNGFVLHDNRQDCKEGSCTYQINSPSGEISSPNYPDYYPSKKECAWLFTTTPGHRIKLLFDEFELEPHQECAYDHIVVYDGDTNESPTLGRFCGSKVPHPVQASANRMYMMFKSDASVQRKGFKATHKTVCGGRLVARYTVEHLYSHAKYGDQNYDNKEDCDWVIVAANNGRLRLTFLTFEVEHEQDCGYDYVDIYDGYDESSSLIGKFCGNKVPPEVSSTGNSLVLRFRSDDTISTKGFSVAYVATDVHEDIDEDFID